MARTNTVTGFFGKLPFVDGIVMDGLPVKFTERWGRWFDLSQSSLILTPEVDARVWRFTVEAGIFADEPVSGVWRMSHSKAMTAYPFVIARLGQRLSPASNWFNVAAANLVAAIDNSLSPERLSERLSRAHDTPNAMVIDTSAAEFWLDDWEVHELTFSSIHDLAENGLKAMLAPRTEPEVL